MNARALILFIPVLLALLVPMRRAFSQDPPPDNGVHVLRVGWCAGPEADLVGYRLRWCSDSNFAVTNPTLFILDVRTNEVRISLTNGPWFLAVTAYNAVGLESDLSDVLKWDPVNPANPADMEKPPCEARGLRIEQ